MWVGAGAAGSKCGGWAGRSCRRPRGRVEAQQRTGSDRAGRGRAREEGRMAWGQSATRKRRREGEGQARAGKRRGQRRPLCGLGGTWAARSGIPGREQSTQKVVFVPMAEHSGADRTAAQQGRDKALAALRPAARQRRREHSSPFILGEICPSSSPANFPSGDRTGCVPGHTHPHL